MKTFSIKSYTTIALTTFACLSIFNIANAIPGDLNGDNLVNARDLRILQSARLGLPAPPPARSPDLNRDGVVDSKDFALLSQGLSGQTVVFRVESLGGNQYAAVGLNLSVNGGTDSFSFNNMNVNLGGATQNTEQDANNTQLNTGFGFTIPGNVQDGPGVFTIGGQTFNIPLVRVPVTVSLSADSVSEERSVTVTASLSNPTIDNIVVSVMTSDGTANAGSDYIATSTDITITAGATSGTAQIALIDDQDTEPTENFTITATNAVRIIGNQPSTDAIVIGQATAQAEIIDNEYIATIDFSATSATLSEGQSTTVDLVFQTQEPNPSPAPVNITFTVDTLDRTTDLVNFPTTVTFPAGAMNGDTQTLNLTANDDQLIEHDESGAIIIQNISGPASHGSQTVFNLTIEEDDSALIEFNPVTLSVTEGASGPQTTATVTIRLELQGQTLARDVSAIALLDNSGTATNGTDFDQYMAVRAEFTQGAADQETSTFDLTINDDTTVEGTETIVLTLVPVSSNTNVGGSLTVSITDDDIPQIIEESFDFDGDGNQDFAVGMPFAEFDQQQSSPKGIIYLFYGTGQKIFGTPSLSDLMSNFQFARIVGSPNDRIGDKVAFGDLDGDGKSDLLTLGAPGSPAVSIIYGQGDGQGGGRLTGNQELPTLLTNLTAGRIAPRGSDTDLNVGINLEVADFDGDGKADLALGNPNGAALGLSPVDEGVAYLIFGQGDGAGQGRMTGELNLRTLVETQNLGFEVSTLTQFTNLGQSIAFGDIDSDGKPDLIIGAPNGQTTFQQQQTGTIYVVYGQGDGQGGGRPVPTLVDFDTNILTLQGIDNGDKFGMAVGAGDFDGDGAMDIGISARDADGVNNMQPDEGESYIYYGQRSNETRLTGANSMFRLVNDGTSLRLFGAGNGDTSHPAIIIAGDLDKDGRADFIFGSPTSPNAQGEVNIVYGQGDYLGGQRLAGDQQFSALLTSMQALKINSPSPIVNLGQSLSVGNFDTVNDNQLDLFIGTEISSRFGLPTSGFVVLSGSASRRTGTLDIATLLSGVGTVTQVARVTLFEGQTRTSVAN